MPKTTDSVIFSDIEREILETALQNPNLSNAEIAEETGARIALVRDTRANYEDEIELAEDVAEEADDGIGAVAAVDDAELSETEAAILDTIATDPNLSNAEVAAETGARIALVRDTRSEYGDAVESSADDTDDSETDADAADSSEPTAAAEPSETQAAILELAEENPNMTNAEIAAEVGARISLVRDTRNEFDDDTDEPGSAVSTSAETDTSEFSESQIEILETAQANPELTNAEIADRTDTRITLVRDTIRQHESDGDTGSAEPTVSDDDTDVSDDDTGVLADVDTDAFSAAQLDILETALENPELTNGEIADRTDSRLTLVRDTRYDYEYDDKPWDKDLDDDQDDEDDEAESETAEETTPSEEPVELPETTDSELLSEAERAILETALENPELTNAEIADRTDSRLTLVRDTRATYEQAVDLPADDSADTDSPGTAGTDRTGEPTDRQREILEAVAANPERTNAEIAAETGARITFVRDTRSAYGEEIELSGTADTTDGTGGDDADDTASDTPEPSETTETATASGGESPTTNTKLIVAVLLLILVIVVLALL